MFGRVLERSFGAEGVSRRIFDLTTKAMVVTGTSRVVVFSGGELT